MKNFSLLIILSLSAFALAQKSNSKLIANSLVSDKLVDKGISAISRKSYASAKKFFEKALKRDEYAYKAQSYLGVLLYLEKKPEEAIEAIKKGEDLFAAYKKKLKQEKEVVVQSLERKRMDITREGTQEAQRRALPYVERIEAMQKEMEQDEKLTFPAFFRFKYGNALYMMQRQDEAMQEFLKIVDEDPEFTDVYTNLAICYFNQNDMENAKKYYKMGKEKGTKFPPQLEEQMK